MNEWKVFVFSLLILLLQTNNTLHLTGGIVMAYSFWCTYMIKITKS